MATVKIKSTRETNSALIAAQVRPSVKEALEQIATAEDRTMSQVVRCAVDKFLESRQPKAVA
jgi:predicted transcriptional regulator